MLKSVTIDNLDIPFDPDWKKIAISVSGGADSALLTALLCDMIKYESTQPCEIHIIQHIRNWKSKPWQQYDAVRIFNYFINNYPDITFYKHNNFIPPEMEEPNTTFITDEYGASKPGNRIILRAHNEWVAHTYKLDAWFAAVNQNPSINIPGALPERDEGVLPLHMKHMGVDVYHPFVNTTKDKIIKEYFKHDIKDLLKLTRSCEGEFDDLDYTTYVPGQDVPECGNCFWCKEREWAIEQVK